MATEKGEVEAYLAVDFGGFVGGRHCDAVVCVVCVDYVMGLR
jgi:hypothetical protein